MKPPQRRRKVPARYAGEASGPAAWSLREKRQLLRLLQARRDQPEPDAAELAAELPGRSEAEVRHFIQRLKGLVLREAIRRVQPEGAEGPRRRGEPLPAPIEVWLELAEKLTGALEEPLAAAFSQVLTIAAAEPLSLLHSKPPKPTKASGKPPLFLKTQEAQENRPPDSGPAPEPPSPAPEPPGPTPEPPGPSPTVTVDSLTGPSMGEDFSVDFEKIYKYLSSRNGPGPELTAAESAVVLDLLLSLPRELPHLPCTALAKHMTETYARLMAPQAPPASGRSPRPEAAENGPKGPEEPGPAPPPAPEPRELSPAWHTAGICPLNPFLVPLELLGRVAPQQGEEYG